ncbi:VanZ family protein [Microbacterium sp. Sa4CUA7]|uniref:VanZ family protein n=1 Tax=Microbacterium pullorum TaxID=2762236 RepID=A0ABR8S639_9MICO|nr:VanZ family protein [Microbacterium pullorum]MBD7958544.1 VanZ family protein [Microbacterium pullorum]
MGQRVRGRRWVLVGLGAYLLGAVVILLAPVSYGGIVEAIGDLIREGTGATWFGYGWIEFSANVVLFAPLGFLLTLLFRRPWWGAATALALSVAAEFAQLFLPSRAASPRDILANALGAAIGAAVAWLWVLRRERITSPSPPTGTTRSR